ncbi:MAG: hypothetical protein NTV75_01575 [Bacteroidia bacterium]|nr:hypothetical protein [Bacteroidia bacterium]
MTNQLKISLRVLLVICSLLSIYSCRVSSYLTDQKSIELQKSLRKHRTGVNIGEGLLIAGSAAVSLFTGFVFFTPEQQAYRKLKLSNQSSDTLFVNMVTDWQWKDSTYFDLKEIVMPPKKSMKVVVPNNVAYNIYFRTNYDAPDDEKVEINTGETRIIKLNSNKSKN